MDVYRWMRQQWDRVAAVIAVIAGLISLLVGWLGVSRSTLPTEQIPYLASGAVFGLFALGVAATLWLSADLRDEWRKLDEIHRTLQGDEAVELAEGAQPAEVLPAPAPTVAVEGVAGGERTLVRNGSRGRLSARAAE